MSAMFSIGVAAWSKLSQRAMLTGRCSLHVTQIKLYDKDIQSSSFFTQNKKYFMDVKESAKGKYLKISELSRGKRFTLMVDGSDVAKFQSSLEESSLRGFSNFTTKNNIEYVLEKRENTGGEFFQCLEKHPDGKIHRLIIAGESLGSVQNILNEFSKDHFQPAPPDSKN
uniref:Transcriptional activator protein pur-alpha n=1 Tax=Pseudodiaptomus poplesia TaxID=213370 RepID=A0A0U2V2D9_9MAXI|nr:transcriptional activator protein pur-alpha [Pseudodiaptomus poplesia]